MSQLIRLRNQIKSIQTTKKITYAMRLISMSLYSKLEKLNSNLNYYQDNLNKIYSTISSNLTSWHHPLLHPQDILDSKPLIIFVTSSKGLCGSFNSNLFKYFKRYFFMQEHQTPTFITVGSKALKFLEEQNLGNILYSYNEFNSNNFLMIANNITKIINEQTREFSSITFYSNIFKSFFLQKPQKTIVTPIDKNAYFKEIEEKFNLNKDSNEDNSSPKTYELEQEADEIMNYLVDSYIKSSITNLLFQSLLAEQASRFLAMDNATNNAENLLEKLNLQYNKSRQAIITKELSELSSSLN